MSGEIFQACYNLVGFHPPVVAVVTASETFVSMFLR